jgi:hypothetical protein
MGERMGELGKDWLRGLGVTVPVTGVGGLRSLAVCQVFGTAAAPAAAVVFFHTASDTGQSPRLCDDETYSSCGTMLTSLPVHMPVASGATSPPPPFPLLPCFLFSDPSQVPVPGPSFVDASTCRTRTFEVVFPSASVYAVAPQTCVAAAASQTVAAAAATARAGTAAGAAFAAASSAKRRASEAPMEAGRAAGRSVSPTRRPTTASSGASGGGTGVGAVAPVVVPAGYNASVEVRTGPGASISLRLFDFFPFHRSHSISFTRAQGIPNLLSTR